MLNHSCFHHSRFISMLSSLLLHFYASSLSLHFHALSLSLHFYASSLSLNFHAFITLTSFPCFHHSSFISMFLCCFPIPSFPFLFVPCLQHLTCKQNITFCALINKATWKVLRCRVSKCRASKVQDVVCQNPFASWPPPPWSALLISTQALTWNSLQAHTWNSLQAHNWNQIQAHTW
jgi:hypothetical protein